MREPVCFPRLTAEEARVALNALEDYAVYTKESCCFDERETELAKEAYSAIRDTYIYPATQPDVTMNAEDLELIESALHLYYAYFEKQMKSGVADAEYVGKREQIPLVFQKLKKLKGE